MQQDLGSFASLVNAGGSIVAMGAALGLTWRGRTKWEPSEEDLPRGVQKVSGLIAALVVATLWVSYHRQPQEIGWKPPIILGALSFFFLLVYSFLISNQTFEIELVRDGNSEAAKVIGGFWMTTRAHTLVGEGRTRQDVLEGAAYNLDLVWPRPSRSLAKISFLVGYAGLVVCGTVALAAASIMVSAG